MASECFSESRVVLGLQLSPRYIGRMSAGVQAHIADKLFKYDLKLGGVPVACSEFKIIGNAGFVPTDFPTINCNVAATLTIFTPQVGQKLTGVVNQTSADHVGLLLFGTFNASISADQLKESYVFDEDSNEWRDSESEDVLAFQSVVQFEVIGFETSEDLFDVRGSIKSLEGAAVVVASEASSRAQTPGKLNASARRRMRRGVQKRVRVDESENEVSEIAAASDVEEPVTPAAKRKPKKIA